MSRYFKSEEFTCKCKRVECDAMTVVHLELLDRLDILRDLLKVPLIITSGLRCAFWNDHEGGIKDSEHLAGEAVDVACGTSGERWRMIKYAPRAGFHRMGVGKTFVHLDISPTKMQNVVWLYGG